MLSPCLTQIRAAKKAAAGKGQVAPLPRVEQEQQAGGRHEGDSMDVEGGGEGATGWGGKAAPTRTPFEQPDGWAPLPPSPASWPASASAAREPTQGHTHSVEPPTHEPLGLSMLSRAAQLAPSPFGLGAAHGGGGAAGSGYHVSEPAAAVGALDPQAKTASSSGMVSRGGV